MPVSTPFTRKNGIKPTPQLRKKAAVHHGRFHSNHVQPSASPPAAVRVYQRSWYTSATVALAAAIISTTTNALRLDWVQGKNSCSTS